MAVWTQIPQCVETQLLWTDTHTHTHTHTHTPKTNGELRHSNSNDVIAIILCSVRVATDGELGALARQVGEQVGGGGQAGQGHAGLVGLGQLVETLEGQQTPLGLGATHEPDQ